MENFNLKKFLVENKLTTNSRIINEEGIFGDIAFGGEEDPPAYAKAQGKNQDQNQIQKMSRNY